ncbi:MAG: glutamine amidotransferase [Terracidiphilus sp.]|jgi:GMP synthase (glutamine-hydrolysing)
MCANQSSTSNIAYTISMPTDSPRALVLSHVTFEDLGTLEAPLLARGFAIENVNASEAIFPLPQAASCDLLIVLGGPIGVYDDRDYPFLKDEIALIAERLSAHKPILGICLGAQLIAAALGARVSPGTQGAEIGWAPLQPAPDLAFPAWFAPLLAPSLSVFHWHGDTFDLPAGALHLAQSQRYANQAFAIGDYALALQFHPEVTADGLESWYVGHACELHHVGISAARLRSDAQLHGQALQAAAALFWNLWLDRVLPPK